MARTGVFGRRALDERLEPYRGLAARPSRGWIRAIRDALGMTGVELADRMGIGQSAVAEMERSEAGYGVRLDTLRRAADALECELVYAFVPRGSLDESVRRQARAKAARHLTEVAHHSRLEDQSVNEKQSDHQLDELTESLIDRPGLWSDSD